MIQSAHWIERVMLGEVALGLCIIAVAVVGAVMLGGRLPVREGMRIVLGLFVVLGAPAIAGGFASNVFEKVEISPLQPANVNGRNVQSNLPPADYDPYAGASFGNE